MRLPPYVARLLELYRLGKLPTGRVAHVQVLHDDWCALLAGTGGCNCDPVVRAVTPIEKANA